MALEEEKGNTFLCPLLCRRRRRRRAFRPFKGHNDQVQDQPKTPAAVWRFCPNLMTSIVVSAAAQPLF